MLEVCALDADKQRKLSILLSPTGLASLPCDEYRRAPCPIQPIMILGSMILWGLFADVKHDDLVFVSQPPDTGWTL